MKATPLALGSAQPKALFSVVLENLNPVAAQKAWVTIGLPETMTGNVMATRPVGVPCEAVFGDHCVHVFAPLAAGEAATYELRTDPVWSPPAFELAEWVADEPAKLLPRFQLKVPDGTVVDSSLPMNPWDGVGVEPVAHWHVEAQDAARMRVRFRTRFLASVFIEGWLDIYSNQEVVPFEIRASYGTASDSGGGTALERGPLGLSMIVGEKPVIDYRVRKGLHPPVWRADVVQGGIQWEAELAVPQNWFRGRTIENVGALLCLPPASRFASAVNDPRAVNLMAREVAPVVGVLDNWHGNDGNYLAFGAPPAYVFDSDGVMDDVNNARRDAFVQHLNQPGSELDARPYAQPSWSNTTGEQPDFGASRCELPTAIHPEPWALFELRYSVQAWMLRPYATREPTGDPMRAADHPNARTYNLRPDERFSAADMLGWPNPVPWFDQWTTSDDQHRSDNMLFGMFALTRSPSIRRTILDMIELQKLDVYQHQPLVTPGKGIGYEGRALGRVLISLCHAYSLGFTDAEPLIRSMVARAWRGACFQSLPSTARVRVLDDNESKYGWNNPDGTVIRAWIPWQESIACMGLYAAWKQLAIPEAKELARIVAKTITSYAWVRDESGKFFCCYGVRWRTDAPGEPLDPSIYSLALPNFDVFVYGMERWTTPALVILQDLEAPSAPECALAEQILAQFPVATWDDAAWRAVR